MTDVPSAFLPEGLSVALVVLFSLALGGLALGAILKTLRERRLAREAATFGPARALTAGEVVLRGVVASEAPCPLELEIHQTGKEWRHKGEWRHAWHEEKREAHVQPFELVLSTGERIRALPTRHVRLITRALHPASRVGNVRVMAARIYAGDVVSVEGTLVRTADAASPYRGTDTGWSLVGSASRPLVVRSEPRTLHHERRSQHWMSMAVAAISMFLISQWVFGVVFWPLVLHGVHCEAEIDGFVTQSTRNGSQVRFTSAHVVSSERDAIPVGTRLVGSISEAGRHRLSRGDHVPFVVSPTDHCDAVAGSHSGLWPLTPVLWLLFGAFLALIVRRMHHRSLDWYDQRVLTHYGTGRLVPV